MGRGGDARGPAGKPATEDDDASSWNVFIHGVAVDVSAFAARHPGGTKPLRIFKNRDATEQFDA